MLRRGAVLAGAVVALALMTQTSRATADVLPPPPDCGAENLLADCTVRATQPAGTFDGTCMQGVDGEYYCRVGESDCYPASPPDPWQIVAEPCPEEAMADDEDDDEGEGCAVRSVRPGASLVGLISVCVVALAALGLGARRRRR